MITPRQRDPRNLLVALDVGTSKIVTLVAEITPGTVVLRTPDGMVNLSWQLLGEPAVSLVVRWEERGSIPIEPPVHRGFGSTMIEQALSAEFDADVDLDYRPAGLVCTVTAKLPLSAGAA